MKRIISIVLSAVLIISAFAMLPLTSTAAGATISYSYSGADSANAGYAQGTITLTAPTGTYWLYWADSSSALSGYYQIAKLTVSGASASHTMPAQTVIPADAVKLIAIKSDSEPSTKTVASAAAVYDIPASKRFPEASSAKKYRFASYSDVHMDKVPDSTGRRLYYYDDYHLQKAFNTAAARNADFIVMSGDYVNNNVDFPGVSAQEWRAYQKVLADSNFCNPVYEAIGNHELWQSVSGGTRDFIKATGLEGNSKTSSAPYFEKTLGGDHFIFMALEGGFYPDRTEEFTTNQLNWLRNRLEAYKNDGKNVYIIEHSLFYKYGAGDRVDGEPYYDIPLKDDQESTKTLKSILQTYKDAIFISGHTHIAFNAQYNYSTNGGTSAIMLHNSSIGGVRRVTGNGLDRNYQKEDAEGYIVDVFGSAIVFNGAALCYNMYDPNCCYIVRTSNHKNNPVPTSTAESTQAPTATDATAQQTTAQQTTAQQTTAQQTNAPASTAIQTISASGYYVKGSFNSWSLSNPLYTTNQSGILSTTIKLNAGTYKFKLFTGSNTWYGNDGTIPDTTTTSSTRGWDFTTGAGDCTLNATGGYYLFSLNTSSMKLHIYYYKTDPYATEPPEPATTVVPTTAAPTSTAASTTTAAPTTTAAQTQVTETTNASETSTQAEIVKGDVDGNGSIDILDTTLVQKYLVNKISLSDNQKNAADVNFDNKVTIRDATIIQMHIAKIITSFSNGGKGVKLRSGASLSSVQSNLEMYYRYSSYDAYQALKKEYKSGSNDLTKLTALENALLSVVDDDTTVYFENNKGWGDIKAYVWNSSSNAQLAAWPGTGMIYVGKNEYGNKLYEFTVDTKKYNKITFTDGGNQTADISLSADSTAYYVSGSSSPYSVTSYNFKPSYIKSY